MPKTMAHELTAADRLMLNGRLTVRSAEELRSRVLEVMRLHSCVEVECSAATDVDLSFIQLVLSARKSAAAAGKTLSLAHTAGGVLLERLRQAGLVGPAGGRPVADQSFWLDQGDR